MVYNPLSWARTDLVEAEVALPPISQVIRVTDADGADIPVQVLERKGSNPAIARIAFIAKDVPSVGYKVYHAMAESGRDYETGLRAGSGVMENGRYLIEISDTTGNIKRIHDKLNDWEVLAGEGNVLETFPDDPRRWDAWNLDRRALEGAPRTIDSAASVTVAETGPVRAVYRHRERMVPVQVPARYYSLFGSRPDRRQDERGLGGDPPVPQGGVPISPLPGRSDL